MRGREVVESLFFWGTKTYTEDVQTFLYIDMTIMRIRNLSQQIVQYSLSISIFHVYLKIPMVDLPVSP